MTVAGSTACSRIERAAAIAAHGVDHAEERRRGDPPDACRGEQRCAARGADGVEDDERSPAAEAIAAEGDRERAERGAGEPGGRHRADLARRESALGEIEAEQNAGERGRHGADSGARQDESAGAAERHCR